MDGYPRVVAMTESKNGTLTVAYEDGSVAVGEWTPLDGWEWKAINGPDYDALFCKPLETSIVAEMEGMADSLAALAALGIKRTPMAAIKELANVAEEEVTGYRERRGDLEWTDANGYVHGQRIGCPDCATEEDAYPEFVRDEETK